MEKKLIKLSFMVLSIVLIFSTFSLNAHAAETKYDIWIAGVQFTSENMVIDSKDNERIQGSATLSVSKRENGKKEFTLVLDNFNNDGLYNSNVYEGKLTRYAVNSYADVLNIVLKKDNTLSVAPGISEEDFTSAYAIWNSGEIKITGEKEANLSIYAKDHDYSVGICSGSKSDNSTGITIKDTNVLVLADSHNFAVGLLTSGSSVVIDGGSVNANGVALLGSTNYKCYAIVSGSQMIIKNGAEVVLSGSSCIINGQAPIIASKGEKYITFASENLDWTDCKEYESANFKSYKYLKLKPDYYNIWVAGIQMSSANMTIDASDNPRIKGSATLSLDESDNQTIYNLQLDNFDNDSLCYDDGDNCLGVYSYRTDLNIIVAGNNTITSSNTDSVYTHAVYTNGKTTIKGNKDAVLNLHSGKSEYWSCALNSDETITINDITLNLSTSININTNAIYTSSGEVFIDGATVVATASDSTGDASYGIETSEGDDIKNIVLKNSASVTIIGSTYATSNPLDLSKYGRDYVILASKSIDGLNLTEYKPVDIMSYKYLKVTPKYKIIEGENNKWTQGSKLGYLIKSDQSMTEFSGILVDDIALDSADYEINIEDNAILLKPSYLQNLSEGKHTIKLMYLEFSEELSTTIIIEKAASVNDNKSETDQKPNNPDNSNDMNKSETDQKPNNPDNSNDMNKSETDQKTNDSITSPTTGDNTSVSRLLMIAFISGMGVFYIRNQTRKTKKSEVR